MKPIDVYCYGMIAPSTVHILREDFRYPDANGYGEVAETLPSIGGEAANSAVVLARLGLRTKLDGCWVNRHRFEEVTSRLAGYGIDVSRLAEADAGTVEFVVADRASRTVFGNYATYHAGPRQWNVACEEDIAAARIVCLDPYFRREAPIAAELCVRHGVPYVTQDAAFDEYVAQHAAAVVVSHELRDQAYAGRDAREVFARYLESCEGLVIFSFGADELWFGRRGGSTRSFRPYEIEPVDTTGAGDSFRGAIAYGLLEGWSDEETIRFASAVAACVCMSYPHALNAPDLATVRSFVAGHIAHIGHIGHIGHEG